MFKKFSCKEIGANSRIFLFIKVPNAFHEPNEILTLNALSIARIPGLSVLKPSVLFPFYVKIGTDVGGIFWI